MADRQKYDRPGRMGLHFGSAVVYSIGLENASEDADLTDVQYKKILEFAVQELGLVNEPLQPMNYMDAVSIWAKGDKI